MKVSNMTSANGNSVHNQFILESENGRTFKSYDSIIAHISPDGIVTLDQKFWNYSQTTGKYRNIFLGETKAKTEQKIKSGVYKLADLN